ncbi:MAG TPA: glycosyl hydrolase family 28-related protein [Tepidisphaeraceae bacterium]|jgi:hypothetical protein
MKLIWCAAAFAFFVGMSARAGELNVRDFGAKGDGVSDDTAAIQKAMDTASQQHGGRVFLPAAQYRVNGHLSVPIGVILAGVNEAPPTNSNAPDGKPNGSILLAYEGKGTPDGPAFITLHQMSQITGLIVRYPEQTEDVIPYPWCVRGDGDNCSITNCLLVNPYQAVDFGNQCAGRHFINGLYGQPLKTGILVDQCYDIGRISNVHFWPFWKDDKKLEDYTNAHAEAFVIARTDWEYMNNCFCISYHCGFHFTDRGHNGPGNTVLTECGSDTSPQSVQIDSLQPHAGVTFVNGQFMCGVRIAKTNAGPVKFTNCGFWGVPGITDSAFVNEGSGTLILTACHFISWAQHDPSAPAIHMLAGNTIINGCEFIDENKSDVILETPVTSAVIMGCRFHSKPQIINRSHGDVQIGLNAVAP